MTTIAPAPTSAASASTVNPGEKIKAEVELYQANRMAERAKTAADLQGRRDVLEQQFNQLNVNWASAQDPLRRDSLNKQKNEKAQDLDYLMRFQQIIATA